MFVEGSGGGGLGVPGCLEWLAGYLWWRTARGGLISVFEEFSAIVDKAFVLAGGLGDELSFIGVQEISWYFLISWDPKS